MRSARFTFGLLTYSCTNAFRHHLYVQRLNHSNINLLLKSNNVLRKCCIMYVFLLFLLAYFTLYHTLLTFDDPEKEAF